MTRRYAEPVEVRRADEAPAQFLWHGRLYVVREVLSTWVEAGAWWRVATRGGEGAPLAGPVLDDGEREYWRVEAAAGRHAAPGVYDLCFDWSSGSWTLARTMD